LCDEGCCFGVAFTVFSCVTKTQLRNCHHSRFLFTLVGGEPREGSWKARAEAHRMKSGVQEEEEEGEEEEVEEKEEKKMAW
jgi:hypothetical protein